MNKNFHLAIVTVFLPFLALLILFIALSQGVLARAPMNIIVDTSADDYIKNGNCTLREAIIAANLDTVVDQCVGGSGEIDSFPVIDMGAFGRQLAEECYFAVLPLLTK